MRFELVGNENNRKLNVEIGNRATQLDGAAVDVLIERLSLLRSSMTPAVSPEMSRTQRYHITINPSWYAEPNVAMKAMVAFFRHEGLGWVGFSFTQQQCKSWIEEIRAAVRQFN